MLANLLVIAVWSWLCSRCRGRILHRESLRVSVEMKEKGKQHPPTLPGDRDAVQTLALQGHPGTAPRPGLRSSVTPPGVTRCHQTCPKPRALLRHRGVGMVRRHFNLNQLKIKQF